MVSVIAEKGLSENGECYFVTHKPKYTRRRVSAVRDFPLGCGPNAQVINPGANNVVIDVDNAPNNGYKCGELFDIGVKMNSGSVSETQTDGKPSYSDATAKATSLFGKDGGMDVEHEREELRKEFDNLGLVALPNGSVVETFKSSENTQKKDSESLMTELWIETHDPLKDLITAVAESSGTMKSLDSLDLKERVKDAGTQKMVEGNDVGSCSLPYYPIPSDIVWRKRKYPPRSRVSATREFPPGCGASMASFNKNDSLKVSSKGDQLLCGDKMDAEKHADILRTDVKDLTEHVYDEDPRKAKMKGVVYGESWIQAQAESKSHKGGSRSVIRPIRISDMEELQRKAEVKSHNCDESKSGKLDYGGKGQRIVGREARVKTERVAYLKESKGKLASASCSQIPSQKKCMAGANDENKIVVVKGLMAAVNCPWRRGRAAVKSSPSTTSMKGNRAKRSNFAWHYKSKALFGKKQDDVGKLTGKPIKSISPLMEGDADERASQMQMVLWNEGDAYDNGGQLQNDLQLIKKWHNLSLPPFGAACSSDKGARIKVRETLRLYQAIVRKLLQEEEAKSMSKENSIRRIDLLAGKILKDKGKYVNTGKQILGPVPGVEVGDEFHYRVELMIIGLHRPLQSGIDYLKVGKKIIATSIVASGGYANDVDSSDVLIYTGQGGNATGGDKQPEDQKLERGNLALKNSIEERNFVRVIRGFKDTKFSEFGDGRGKVVATYTYDGLYIVKKYWQDIGPHGKMVYKFELRRVLGQSDLSWKHVKSKKFKAREGRCVDDISEGKEAFPICAVNTIDNEKPPKFTYITRMVFPDWYHSIPPRGCDCVNGCSDSEKCACAVRNGGEIPYNYNGAIVEAKPLVYECGPCCKCPSSCHNRVSQHGIKFQLEIFKTESRGWGVRSLSSIPSGSFICEYLGELLEDKEAEQRTGSDEYLFDIGQNYNDRALWDGLSTIMPDTALSASEVVEEGFTIDAAKYGNVGRFINHSCSPNLYAQNVLYDNDDKRIPHIMLFAAENIPPLQEMTYHYNYTIDEVRDSDGNTKRKNCYCGSSECSGRMY